MALRLLLNRLDTGFRSRILDLGPAVGANVNFFSRFSCKLYIADLYGSLRTAGDSMRLDDGALRRQLHEQLLSQDPAPCDLIFAWDLLNYLGRDEVETLGRQLVTLCHPDTILFLMISTRKLIPDRPQRFEILDRSTLGYESLTDLSRPCPRYKEPDLARHMPDFEVETSFLLRNGVQEYLLTPRPRIGGEST